MTGSLRGSDSQQNLVGRQPSAARLLPTPVTVSGVSVVSTVWLLATFIIVSALVVAGGFPFWIHNHDPQQLGNQLSRADVGIYYFCYNLSTDQSFRECIPYLQFTPPSNLTHGLEEAELEDIAFLFSSSIVFAFGLGMLVISLVVGVVAYCKPRIKKHSMFVVAFVFQVVGGECA